MAWNLIQTSGIVNANNCTIENSIATGGAIFNANPENGNIDNGGNSGWNFISPLLKSQILLFVCGYSIPFNIGVNIINGYIPPGSGNGSIVIVEHNPFVDLIGVSCTITDMSIKRVGEDIELVEAWYNNYPGNPPSPEHWPVFETTGPNYLHIEDNVSPFNMRFATSTVQVHNVGDSFNISFNISISGVVAP